MQTTSGILYDAFGTALVTLNIEFSSDGHMLTGIRIWNYMQDSKGKYVKKNGHNERIWEAELGIKELRSIARKFVALLLEGDL